MELIVPNELLRGARAALGVEQKTLATAAGLVERTVRRVEAGKHVDVATLEAMAAALETEGVRFISSEGAAGPGFRMSAPDSWRALLRGARAARKLTLAELSKASGISERTLLRMETDSPVFPNTLRSVREALEADGVTFLTEERGSGPGFRIALALLNRKDLRF